jgi:predicted DNA-binding transcriptional regulator AlpA
VVASIDGVQVRGELVTLNGAAVRLGLTRSTMDTHALNGGSRRNPFPEPVLVVSSVRLWRVVDVDRWAANRQVRREG